MPQHESNGKSPQFQKLFELFGCEFVSVSGAQARAAECPFCGKGKFGLNIETGQYQCLSANTCAETGNAYTFINWIHKEVLEKTSDEDYHRLRNKRKLPLQTLKRHELAWSDLLRAWLIPYKSKEKKVQNLTYYYDDGRKYSLPGLPLRLYGLNDYSIDLNRLVFVLEGAFDAIALDHHLREKKTRSRYDILAVPSATVFRPEWLEYLEGRTGRLCLDKDKAGQTGQERIARLVREQNIACDLLALQWPDSYPDKCDISDLIRDGVNIAEFTRDNCFNVRSSAHILFKRGDEIPTESPTWLWEKHIPFSSFVSLSGFMGTHKSGIARDVAARATAGLSMPLCKSALPPFNVLYFTSEDSESNVCDIVGIHRGDLSRLYVHDIASGKEPIDILTCLHDIEHEIKRLKARLVILDALNSFVGGDISTDAKARRTLTGRLQALARRTGACIIGIRNWGRADGGTASQKALGATSLSDVARCVMNTLKLPPSDPSDKTEPPRYQLEFEKVSNARQPDPIPYEIKDLSESDADSHYRRIIWNPNGALIEALKKVAKKGSTQ